jgi:hypothetical protein
MMLLRERAGLLGTRRGEVRVSGKSIRKKSLGSKPGRRGDQARLFMVLPPSLINNGTVRLLR